MKKLLLSLACILMGFTGAAQAATVDDLAVLKHNYVLVLDDWCGNGTAKPGKGELFGDGYFLDVTGGSVATSKGSVNLSLVNEADENHVTQAIADKYGADYPDTHLNSWRLKNAQDVIAMKVTAGSKLIFFLHGNNKTGTDARIPKIAKDAALSEVLNAAPDADFPPTSTGFRYEWTATDDGVIYVGSYNGDIFVSYIIVEIPQGDNGTSLTVAEELKRGEEFLLPVNIEFGKQNYTAFQMDVELPQGVSFVQDEEDYAVAYNPERVQSDHVIATNLLDGTNTLRIAGFSGTNKTFKGSDGEFLNVKVKVADNAWGNYEIKVSNIAFSNTKGQDDIFADASASFAVKKHKLTYIVDEQDYQSDSLFYGATIEPLADATKEGYTFSGWSEIPEIMPAEDVVVTGTFSINSYLLTYKVDGDTVKSDSIVYASALTLIDEPTKEGYTFSGWSELPQTMPAKDVVVTGDFTINSYLLTYKVDGDTVKSDSIVYASALTLIDEPTKEGYTFSGWSELPQTMPAKDVVVTGEFTINSYLLTYKVDGDTVKSDSIVYASALTLIDEPTKEGYTFSGWSEIPEIMPAKDVVVTGEFTINSYLLTYKVDGDTVKSDSIVYASALTLIDEPTKEGYTFSGWSELPQTMPAKDVVVTGEFTINSYLLTYKVDGDTVKSDSIVYGTALTLIDEPTKEGYTFSGWSELPQTMPAKDVVVTGTFTINSYLLTYKVDGETVKSDSIAYGTALTLIDAPTKEGYTFSGWSELPQTMPAKDVVVTGEFTINSYLLTYKVDGETLKSDSIVFGTALTLIDAPTKEGYTFSGWSELPQTMPAQDVVVSGTFTINSYLLTYKVDGETVKSDSIAYGTALTLIDAPTKEGYTFSGWSELPQTMPAQDVVVTGTFTINSYVVTFTADGKVIKSETLTYGTAITAPENPTKEGYTFVGWNPELDATVPAKDVTYEAVYQVNVYAVVYMVNGKEWARDSVAYGETIVLKQYTPAEGETFNSWTSDQEYTTMPAHDVVYTANITTGIWGMMANREFVDVYNLQGGVVARRMPVKDLKKRLPRGVYIIEGRKVAIK